MKKKFYLLSAFWLLFCLTQSCSNKDEIISSSSDPNSKTLNLENTDEIKNDIKISVIRGEASSFQAGEGIEKSFDGDSSTLYHSKWNNQGNDYFPITLTYYFDQADKIDYMVYHPRTNGSNGLFKNTEILWSKDGKNFTKLMDKDFKGALTSSTVRFETPLSQPKAIRIIVKSGAGDGQGFASCSEMEFYKKNQDNFDVLTLFSDKSCSELKSGISKDDIQNCSSDFFKQIALALYNNTYPRDFRISEYKAYPNPQIQAKLNKTNPYSLLDNPTGISVQANDNLVVLVGDTHGYEIGLKVQNLDRPGGDGFGGDSYALNPGINKIKIKTKGLVYLMYHTPTLEELTSAPTIKAHFATGKVNGYFDISKHTEADWQSLLNNTCNQYFDVLGKYVHLTFPVQSFKDYTKNGKDLIDTYDEVVKYEMEFMGLFKYNHVFKNRMYMHVMYHSYMYASPYHTAYNVGTMSNVCDETRLRAGEIWGPAHEIGHCNQTRPGLKWHSTTEVTNNIHSMAVQTHFCEKYGSNYIRLRDESMRSEGFTNRYEKAMTNAFTATQPHCLMEDVFCRLIPFWQLQLYMANVKGEKDFYKDLYEAIRVESDKKTPGENQLAFTIRVCKIAQLDLTNFFTHWGFFRTVDQDIDDYGVRRVTITQQEIDTTLQKIKALNLPEPTHEIQYICEHNLDSYKNSPSVQRGTAIHNGQELSMSNWQNVVAYEVYNGNQLVFVSPESTFTVGKVIANNFKVYALSANGKKTLVTF